jgi:CTP:phosphocholine cytidylyltransferase-like protein
MNSSILRELWSLIENIQPHVLVDINENELIEQVLKQLEEKTILNIEVNDSVSIYISSKMCLIRDLAESKLAYA